MIANAAVLRARRMSAALCEESIFQHKKCSLSSKMLKDLSSYIREKCWERFFYKAIALCTYRALASFGKLGSPSISCEVGVSPQSRPRLLRGDFVGSPIAPESKGKNDGIDPALCPHEDKKMKRRGNMWKKWWTCTGCGGRWERVNAADTKEVSEEAGITTDDEFELVIYGAEEKQKPPCERKPLCKKGKDWWNSVTPDQIPHGDDKMTFGKYKGNFTCQEVFENEKGYCTWVISKVNGGDCSRQLLLFAHFIMQRDWDSYGSDKLIRQLFGPQSGFSHGRHEFAHSPQWR